MSLRNRHWKQRFDPTAQFVWNKAMLWAGENVKVGDPIPDELKANDNRLRRFWESGAIQLAGFEAPDVTTGQAPEPEPEPEEDDPSHMNGPDEDLSEEGADDSPAPDQDTANWRDLSYKAKLALARTYGLEGRNPGAEDLDAYLETKIV